MKAILALEDGSLFHGAGFGARASACGEVCFNTSMTGYQEILTDPSYKGQIVTMTYPLIGNYGVNQQDVESWKPHVAGFVIRELSPVVSNWRAEYSLAEYLEGNGIPGIQGIDTRALTKRLRVRGALNGFISTEGVSETEAVRQAREWPGLVGVDYVKAVTHKTPFLWDQNDEQSASFSLVRGAGQRQGQRARAPQPLPPADIPIVAYDYGMKYNILRRLRQHGFKVQVVPATTPAAEALKVQAGGDIPLQRSRRPGGARLCREGGPRPGPERRPDFRHLPRPPDPRPGGWGQDLQAQVRPSGRQSAGQGPRIGPRRDYRAEPRICRGPAIAARRTWRWTASTSTTKQSRECATRPSRYSASNTTRRPRLGRTIRRRSLGGSAR